MARSLSWLRTLCFCRQLDYRDDDVGSLTVADLASAEAHLESSYIRIEGPCGVGARWPVMSGVLCIGLGSLWTLPISLGCAMLMSCYRFEFSKDFHASPWGNELDGPVILDDGMQMSRYLT